MSTFTKRAQVLLTEEQYSALELYARKNNKPLGTVIREAIEKNIISREQSEKRKEAAEQILSMNLPTVNWKKFKSELAGAHASCGIKRNG